MIHRLAGAVCAAALVVGLAASPAAAQLKIPPAPMVAGVPVEHIKVHSPSLAGNLEGEPVDRNVIVVLPPSYAKAKARRYPVLYFLHGFALNEQSFFDFMHLPETVEAAAKSGMEFIIVVPDSDTKLGGTMYSNSPVTGDAEAYIAKDVVKYVDTHYRTLAKRESRGLVGHSMGGYGTWKIAMRFPEMWSSVYAMSACCMSPRTTTAEAAQKLAAIPYDKAPGETFGAKASLASLAAWSPNPKNPPYYMDFGVTPDGSIDSLAAAKWANNSPLAMAPSHLPQLKSFKAIASDGGDKDGLTKDATTMHEQLDTLGVTNSFEVYQGDHTNRIVERFKTKILPFFAQNLAMK
jgi:enterochelin esterase-like enzyme